MDEENIINTNVSYGRAIFEVIPSFLDEEKERSKRHFNVIVHNVEESSAENGQARKEQYINIVMSVFDKYMGVKLNISKANRIGKKRDPGPNAAKAVKAGSGF